MKLCFPAKLAILFTIAGIVQTRVFGAETVPKTAKSMRIEQFQKSKVKSAKPQEVKAKSRKLTHGTGTLVSAISIPEKAPKVKTRMYTPEELVQNIENYGHQAWECANELRDIIKAAAPSDPKNPAAKAPTVTELTLDQELKVKQAISFVREANTALKYYIDNFILTQEVLEKYERYIEQHPDQASSTNGVLKFMVHEFRDIQLRKFEREFFEKVKMYNSVIKDKFTPLFFLPLVNKNVHTLQIKLLNGERLIIFIKKYMAFVMRLKRGFHMMDYEPGNSLFKEPDVDPKVDRFRIVSGSEYTRVKNVEKRKKGYVPVTIVVGNEGFGSKSEEPKKKLPSEYIENKEEIRFGWTGSGQVGSIGQNTMAGESITLGQQSTLAPTSLGADGKSIDQQSLESIQSPGTLVSSTIPAKRLADQQFISNPIKVANNKIMVQKFVNPLEAEKDQFIKQKMDQIEQLYGQNSRSFSQLLNYQNSAVIDATNNGKTIAPTSISNANTGAQSMTTISPAADDKQATLIPQSISKEGSIQTLAPSSISETQLKSLDATQTKNRVVQTGEDSLVELDKDGMPVNLEILRVPEVIRMDERYQDPLVIAGHPQTSLSDKVAKLEGQPVDAAFKTLKPTASSTPEIPLKRVIYRPNEVAGGIPQPKTLPNTDLDLDQLDDIIKDNGTIDKAQLRHVDKLLGLRSARSLWDKDIGAVYSRIRHGGLI